MLLSLSCNNFGKDPMCILSFLSWLKLFSARDSVFLCRRTYRLEYCMLQKQQIQTSRKNGFLWTSKNGGYHIVPCVSRRDLDAMSSVLQGTSDGRHGNLLRERWMCHESKLCCKHIRCRYLLDRQMRAMTNWLLQGELHSQRMDRSHIQVRTTDEWNSSRHRKLRSTKMQRP